MKKTAAALFSVSITAGTLYLAYSGVKSYQIKKTLELWSEEAKKKEKTIDLDKLKKELEDKLYSWDIYLLHTYSKKAAEKAPEEKGLWNKIQKKKLLEKADLSSLAGIIFNSTKTQ